METTGILLAFRLGPHDREVASALLKRLVGKRATSHGGKYEYRRKGLLDEIPHARLIGARSLGGGRTLNALWNASDASTPRRTRARAS